MTKQPSPGRSGTLTGAILGAVCRPAVVSAFWLAGESQPATWAVLLFSSCAIGAAIGGVTGWVAGSIRHPVGGPAVGAAVGAALTFGSSVVTLVFLCIATEGGGPSSVGPYWAAMALAGAVPGLGGGLAAARMRRRRATGSGEIYPPDGADDPLR
jgi:hypothetical protein